MRRGWGRRKRAGKEGERKLLTEGQKLVRGLENRRALARGKKKCYLDFEKEKYRFICVLFLFQQDDDDG